MEGMGGIVINKLGLQGLSDSFRDRGRRHGGADTGTLTDFGESQFLSSEVEENLRPGDCRRTFDKEG